MPRWELFIDESGDLSTDGQWSVVAGVLMRKPIADHRMRAALNQGAVGVRHPHHASYCNRLTGLLAARRLGGSAQSRKFELAWRALQHAPSRLIGPYSSSIEQGRMPRMYTLMLLDAWLAKHDQAACRALGTEKWRHYERFRKLFAWVAKEGEAHIVGAATRQPGSDEGSGRVQGEVPARIDRYLSCLRALLERVVLMARDGQPQQIDISVATRHVPRPTGPASDLRADDVDAAVRDVIAYPACGTHTGDEYQGLRIHAVSAPKYDAQVPAGIVMADYAANRLGATLLHGGSTGPLWSKLNKDIHRSLRMRVNAPAPSHSELQSLPMVACDGPPRDMLRAGLRGETVTPDDIKSKWARTQVERWLEVSR